MIDLPFLFGQYANIFRLQRFRYQLKHKKEKNVKMPPNNRVGLTFAQCVPIILLLLATLLGVALQFDIDAAWVSFALVLGSFLGAICKHCGWETVAWLVGAVLFVSALKGIDALIAGEDGQVPAQVPGPSAEEMLAECLARGDC